MTKHTSRNRIGKLAVLTAAVLMLGACGGKDGGAGEAQKQQQAPAPVVGVVTVRPQDVAVDVELPGRLEAFRSVDVRPQVGGIIKRRLFEEGSYVHAGQALYQLDDATYTAALEGARAQLASAEAALTKANADLARYKPLVSAEAISKQEYDAAVAAKRSAEAAVKSARAAIRSAQINVNYSRITAPISGFIGQSNVSEGALVSANDSTVLANIKQTDPMYLNVTQSANEIMKLRRQIADGKLHAVNGRIEVGIKLEDGSEYARKGYLMFADPAVDQNTGQVTLRVGVPNPDNILLPNLYVRAVMAQSEVKNAFTVPQQAVTRGQQDTLLIVNNRGGMESRTVSIIGQQGSNWIITDGLKEGDKVIVEGTSIAGMMQAKTVTPKEWTPPSGNTAAAPAAAATPASGATAASAPAAGDNKAASETQASQAAE